MMTMKLLLGTSNKGKITEIREALRGLPIDFFAPQDIDLHGSPSEKGMTFAENARIKARFFFEKSKLPTVADDSGIVVEALRNELGLHTRRWGAGPDASDREWIEYFLKRMERERNRRAHFHCSIAYIDAGGTLHEFQGDCPGTITRSLEASSLPGLPISACFRPNGFHKVFSALPIAEKNTMSHRGRALSQLRLFLERHPSAQ